MLTKKSHTPTPCSWFWVWNWLHQFSALNNIWKTERAGTTFSCSELLLLTVMVNPSVQRLASQMWRGNCSGSFLIPEITVLVVCSVLKLNTSTGSSWIPTFLLWYSSGRTVQWWCSGGHWKGPSLLHSYQPPQQFCRHPIPCIKCSCGNGLFPAAKLYWYNW